MEDKDIFESEWEQELPPENEMKQIQKSIQKRNWKIVSISVMLVLTMLLGCVYGVVPAVEQLYWHPYDGTVGEGVTDLTLVLSAYTELFQPGWVVDRVYSGKDGFASYGLNIVRQNTATKEYKYMTGAINKGQLHWDYHFTSERAEHILYKKTTWFPYLSPWEEQTDTVTILESLPEYVTVEARVSFSENQDMEQILKLREDYQLPITWIGIQNAPVNIDLPLCGMSPFSLRTHYFEVNEKYPQFCLETSINPGFTITAADLENHFISLLQLSSDMLEAGRGARVFGGDRNYYQEVLDFVDENGVMSYCMIAVTTPQTLLKLMDNKLVSDIGILDGWLDIG